VTREAWRAARGFPVTWDHLPHGRRARYVAGCRCDECRAGNRLYARARTARIIRGGWNGTVPADQARKHLRALSRAGVGRRAVHDACGISQSVLSAIRRGRKSTVRRDTERRILAVDRGAISDHALVAAGPTWRKVRELLEEGFTQAELARRLGYVRPALQFGARRVTAVTALRVERLWRQYQEPAA
jgi:hypothetical protein